jgi:hypothetical protein
MRANPKTYTRTGSTHNNGRIYKTGCGRFFDQYSAPHGNLWTGGGTKRGRIQRTKNVYGFYRVSSIERLPIETVLTSQTENFKAIRLA